MIAAVQENIVSTGVSSCFLAQVYGNEEKKDDEHRPHTLGDGQPYEVTFCPSFGCGMSHLITSLSPYMHGWCSFRDPPRGTTGECSHT